MGMGEPLANYRAVVPAIRILLDDYGFGLSKRRVTVSTSGMVPFMDRLREEVDVALAVSLHAPTDALRDELVPINRKYPLAELMGACDRYVAGKERRAHVVWYVLLAGVNDTPAHAKSLAALLRDRPAKVNLIPFNPFEGSGYERPAEERIRAFQDTLHGKGVRTTVRESADDIDVACGQLVGRVASAKRHFRDVPIRVESKGESGMRRARRRAAACMLMACAVALGGCATSGDGVDTRQAAEANASLGADYLRRNENDQALARFARAGLRQRQRLGGLGHGDRQGSSRRARGGAALLRARRRPAPERAGLQQLRGVSVPSG